MGIITQKQFGVRPMARSQRLIESQEFGVKKPRTTNSLLRTILFFSLILVAFALGLYLGGKTIYNKYLREVQELRQTLNENHNSAIIVPAEMAREIGYQMQKKDLIVSEGQSVKVTEQKAGKLVYDPLGPTHRAGWQAGKPIYLFIAISAVCLIIGVCLGFFLAALLQTADRAERLMKYKNLEGYQAGKPASGQADKPKSYGLRKEP